MRSTTPPPPQKPKQRKVYHRKPIKFVPKPPRNTGATAADHISRMPKSAPKQGTPPPFISMTPGPKWKVTRRPKVKAK